MRLWIYTDETIAAMCTDARLVVNDEQGDPATREEARTIYAALMKEGAKRRVGVVSSDGAGRVKFGVPPPKLVE